MKRYIALVAGVSLVSVLIIAFATDQRSRERTANNRALIEQITQEAIEGCERAKLDRIDTLRGLRGIDTQQANESRGSLQSRVLLCEPLIRKGASVPDRPALRGAR